MKTDSEILTWLQQQVVRGDCEIKVWLEMTWTPVEMYDDSGDLRDAISALMEQERG